MNNPVRTVEPTVEPVTLDEVKAWLAISGTAEDTMLTSMIKTARIMVENYLNRTLTNTTWKLVKDEFPRRGGSSEFYEGEFTPSVDYQAEANFYGINADELYLPMGDVSAVSSVKYYDTADALQTLSTDIYFLNLNKLSLKQNQSWLNHGLRDTSAVEVTYVAGYGALASNVPEDIRTAVLMTVGALYDSRGCSGMPKTACLMLVPYMLKKYIKPKRYTIQRG